MKYILPLILAIVLLFYYLANQQEVYTYSNPQIVTEKREAPKTEEEIIIELIKVNFPQPEIYLAIAKAESKLNPRKESETDLMRDGRPFTVGLFQINLTWHKIGELNCPKAFMGKDYEAVVVNEKLYSQCLEQAKEPEKNIRTASKLPLSHYGAFNNKSYLKYL